MAIRQIERLVRLSNSVNGNPRYRVFFVDGSNAITLTDAAINYSIGNPEIVGNPRLGVPVPNVEVTFTKNGRIADVRPVS